MVPYGPDEGTTATLYVNGERWRLASVSVKEDGVVVNVYEPEWCDNGTRVAFYRFQRIGMGGTEGVVTIKLSPSEQSGTQFIDNRSFDFCKIDTSSLLRTLPAGYGPRRHRKFLLANDVAEVRTVYTRSTLRVLKVVRPNELRKRKKFIQKLRKELRRSK